MSAPLPEQALPNWRRAVLKVGSNLLAADGGGLTERYATALAGFVVASHAAGRQVVLVSSGAVAAGRALLREHAPAVLCLQGVKSFRVLTEKALAQEAVPDSVLQWKQGYVAFADTVKKWNDRFRTEDSVQEARKSVV